MTGGSGAADQPNAATADKALDDAGDEICVGRPKSRAVRGPGRDDGSTSAAARAATTRTGRTERNTAALIDTGTSARLFLYASMHRRFVDIPRDKALATGVISAATVSNYFKPQSPRKRAGWPLASAEHVASVTDRLHSSSMAAAATQPFSRTISNS